MRIRVCSAAASEFSNALHWYAERNPKIALAFNTEFDEILEKIAESPERFPRCDDRHRYALMRRFPYQIIFRMSSAPLTVIALAHTSREPSYWAGR